MKRDPFSFGELFAGVSGMGMGLENAGFCARWRVELDRAAAGVLAHHNPHVPVDADVVGFAAWLRRLLRTHDLRFLAYLVSLIAGGSPCQDLSVAGKRAGLAGERSGLFRTMVRICRLLRPRFVLWENVDGALSSNDGRDFACVIGAFTGCVPEVPDDGWGSGGFARAATPGWWNVAWRVFDSQHFGVPQRRHRVFLVASLGDGSCVEVLFEPESVRGDSPPRRETREDVAGTLASRTGAGGGLGTDMELSGGLVPDVVGALSNGAHNGGGLTAKTLTQDELSPPLARALTTKNTRNDAETETLIPTRRGGFFDDAIPINDAATRHTGTDGSGGMAGKGHGLGVGKEGDPMFTLTGGDRHMVAHTLRGEGFDASEDGTGRGTPLVADVAPTLGKESFSPTKCSSGQMADFCIATPFDSTQITSKENRSQPQPGAPCHPLAKSAHPPAIAFNLRGREGGAMPEPADVASVRAASGGSSRSYVAFSAKDSGSGAGEVAPTLRAGGHSKSHQNGGVMPAVAITPDVADPLSANEAKTYSHEGSNNFRLHNVVAGVRRLTPRECERLQGWPDDHTRFRRKLRRVENSWIVAGGGQPIEQADGPRYKQCGNGVTRNVAEWIGHRIARAIRGEPINAEEAAA